MNTHTAEQLEEIIRLHIAWRKGEPGGVRADLIRADLSGADLRGADLSGADLSGADLSGASGTVHAAASWSGHGECGRQLLAVRIGAEDVYFCGCFRGSAGDLQKYITAGAKEYRASRQRVFDFVRGCMEESK